MKPGLRVCDTCHTEIKDDLCRLLILSDPDYNPRVLYFHWFSPCWSIEDFCRNYPYLEIIKAGYDCNEEICDNPELVKKLQSNLEFWL